MQITIVLKQKLEFLPPIINLIDCLIDLNVEVTLICTELTEHNSYRYNKTINIKIIQLPVFKFRPLKVFSICVFRNKFYNYLVTNRCYWINKEYDNNNAFAFTKADEKISKIYKSSKNET